MDRYHFNVFDGDPLLDAEGEELRAPSDARTEAIRRFGALLMREADHLGHEEDLRMEVTDDRGLVLFRLDFTVMKSAALS
jgi:hypothetical protein